jgi:putative flippase GtrA
VVDHLVSRLLSPTFLGRGLRFCAVGVTNTLLGLGLIWLAWRWWGWHDLAANALGYAAGFAWSFTLNRHWTFRHEGARGASLARFALVCTLAYAFNLAVLAVARSATRQDSFWPHVLAVGAYTVVAFLGSHFYAFRAHRSPEPQP